MFAAIIHCSGLATKLQALAATVTTKITGQAPKWINVSGEGLPCECTQRYETAMAILMVAALTLGILLAIPARLSLRHDARP